MRQVFKIVGSAVLAVIVALALAIYFFVDLPRSTIVMATGGESPAYQKLAATWVAELNRFGVKLVLRNDLEGSAARAAVLKGDVQAALIKGGLSSSKKWFSYGTDAQVTAHESSLRSLGRMFDEPLWVYYRRPATGLAEGLRDFKGKTIWMGTANSGSAELVSMLLHANGISDQERGTKLIPKSLPDDAAPLIGDSRAANAADVAFISQSSDSTTVKRLLDNPDDILLMDFSKDAGAYLGKFPFLSTVTMHRGAHAFDPKVVPSADITLLSTAPALVVHQRLDPTLAALLTHVSVTKPRPAVDPATGYPVMFHTAGKYPHIKETEYEVQADASTYYKAGELPLILRSIGPFNARLGLPFWVTALISQHGTKILLLAIPILSILVPLGRFIPVLYAWIVRRRLLQWYDRLKTVEATLNQTEATQDQVRQANDELQSIDDAVSRLRIPRQFSEQLYDLRSHISLVEQRLGARLLRTMG